MALRILVALVLFLHGFSHMVGVAGAWRLSDKLPYKTTVVGNRIDVGHAGIKLVGALWMLAAVAFTVAAIAVVGRAPWWPSYAAAVSLASLALCVVGWPEARIGLAINAVLIALLVLATRTGWLAASI